MKGLLRPTKLSVRLPSTPWRHFAFRFNDRGHVEEEELDDYDPAKYCPIHIGTTIEDTWEGKLEDSYTTMAKLEFGNTSTTWLCKEHKHADPRASMSSKMAQADSSSDRTNVYKVLKVGVEFIASREKAMLWQTISADPKRQSVGSKCIRQPESVFDFYRNGQTYTCFVFKPLGQNLFEYIKRTSSQ